MLPERRPSTLQVPQFADPFKAQNGAAWPLKRTLARCNRAAAKLAGKALKNLPFYGVSRFETCCAMPLRGLLRHVQGGVP
ncbi:hypothetical protein [Leisingera sp. M658]|uniref:hypothetical protein n=1 Tax=Leisingera sp. M658 TaxID=2867015 RepID=UPI0021A4CFA0|nr:hypothetical protein [Leisingera sp. M658]UWQ75778.1 hypothetical protein K3724_04800 [Leisingera sp. M658]